nr:MAG TPA_asm: hypothetical protein [Caudoviricetes sp.]
MLKRCEILLVHWQWLTSITFFCDLVLIYLAALTLFVSRYTL